MSGNPDTPNPTLDRQIGRRLAERRTALAITVEDLATQAGIKPQLLRDMEAGKARIEPGTMFELCRALDVDAAHLFPDPAKTFGHGEQGPALQAPPDGQPPTSK